MLTEYELQHCLAARRDDYASEQACVPLRRLWLPDRHLLTTPENVTQEEATQFMEMARLALACWQARGWPKASLQATWRRDGAGQGRPIPHRAHTPTDSYCRRTSIRDELSSACSNQGKIVGVICHAGLVGISAGIVSGHRATGSPRDQGRPDQGGRDLGGRARVSRREPRLGTGGGGHPRLLPRAGRGDRVAARADPERTRVPRAIVPSVTASR